MANNSPILNVDLINVLNEINGTLKFDQVAIEQRGCEIIEKLEQMLENENQSVLDMQSHFTRAYEKKDDYRMPHGNKLKSKYNYCYPNSYKSSFIEGIEYPKIFSFNEYMEHLKEHRNLFTEELKAKYEKKLKNREITRTDYNEYIADIPNEVEKKITELISSLKLNFYKTAKRYVQADNFYRSMQEVSSDNSCKMVSTETIGFTTYEYQINDDIEFVVKTNFGFGHASYFFVNLRYKGIDILPYSDYVKYYFARMADFVRYTRLYDVQRDSWNIAFSFVEQTGNMAITTPKKFIHVWIQNECEEMMAGLRAINQKPEQSLKHMISKFGHNEENQFDHSICLRNVRQAEVDSYMVYPHEMTIAYRVEKVTGALLLLEKMKALTSLYSTVIEHINEIKEMNKGLLPDIEKNMASMMNEIKKKESLLKKEDAKLIALEEANASWYDEFNPRKYTSAFMVPRIDWFLSKNPKYRDAYNEISVQADVVRKIKEDIEQRMNFYKKLESGKELIQSIDNE